MTSNTKVCLNKTVHNKIYNKVNQQMKKFKINQNKIKKKVKINHNKYNKNQLKYSHLNLLIFHYKT